MSVCLSVFCYCKYLYGTLVWVVWCGPSLQELNDYTVCDAAVAIVTLAVAIVSVLSCYSIRSSVQVQVSVAMMILGALVAAV